jgi:hypothetical protein
MMTDTVPGEKGYRLTIQPANNYWRARITKWSANQSFLNVFQPRH